MKILFFGTSNVALPVLEALKKEHEILAVVTTPDAQAGRKQDFTESPVSALARDLNLLTLKPDSPKKDPEFLEKLKQLNADIFVVVSYGRILPVEIINLPRLKTVNVHFSVLPKYRGPSPMQFALLNGETHTGTTIFVLDEQVDHGPLLAQEIIEIDPDDNFITLADKLSRLSAKIINPTLAYYASGKITPLPQDEAAATHTKIINKVDGKIDWAKPARQIYNQFRAFYPWPGIWTTWNGKTLKLININPDPRMESGSTGDYGCGTVLQGGVVACGENTFLQIKTLQLEGKNETDIDSFLRGYKELEGSKLIS